MKGAIKNSMTIYLGSDSGVGSWNSAMKLTMKINQTGNKIEVNKLNLNLKSSQLVKETTNKMTAYWMEKLICK